MTEKKAPVELAIEAKGVRVRELAIAAATLLQDGQRMIEHGDGFTAAMVLRQAADALETWQFIRNSYHEQLRMQAMQIEGKDA